jgi:ribA/ribD-fused uncharacterized protein
MNIINIISSEKNGYEKLSNLLNGPVKSLVNRKYLEFKTIEHLYQIKKALFYKEYDTAFKIYNCETGWETTKLGKLINKSEQSEWDKISSEILEQCMIEGFSQNPESVKLLLSTKDSTLIHKWKYPMGKWEEVFPNILTKIRNYYNI